MSNNTTSACLGIVCEFTTAEITLMITSTFIVITIGIVGNISTGIVVISSKKLRSISNLSTLNLALSDFLLSVFVAPLWIVYMYITEEWVFGAVFCKVYYFLMKATVYATLLNLFVVSIERFMAVCFPFCLRMRKNIFIYCVPLVWLLAFGMAAPNLVYRVHGNHAGESYCLEDFPNEDIEYNKAIGESFIFFALMFTMIPMQIATICSLRIRGIALRDHSHANYIRRRNASYMLLILMLSCFICWTPTEAVMMAWRFDAIQLRDMGAKNLNILYFVITLMFFSCIAIHPLIFFFLSPRGKRTLNTIIKSTRRRDRPNSAQSSKASTSSKKRMSWPFSGLSIRGSSLHTKESAF